MKLPRNLSLLILLSCLISCSEKPEPGKQVLITEGYPNQVVDAYWLYLPKEYSEEKKKWPLIMYLQGGDASASPNPRTVKDGGPIGYLPTQPNLPNSFIVVNPHMRTGTRENRQWFKNADALVQIINQTIKEFNVDPERIYLTGQSRGGHGTWGVAKQFPETFTAIAPIAGAITCKSNCEKVVDIPTWIIHNVGDPVVSYDYPLATVDYFENKLGRSFLKTTNLPSIVIADSTSIFTTFNSDQHGGAGAKVYSSPEFYDWLLSHTKNSN